MKKGIVILVLLITSFGFIFTDASALMADDVRVMSNEMPSSSYMKSESQSEKQGYLYNMNTSTRDLPAMSMLNKNLRAVGDWEDPEFPGDDEIWEGNHGGPIGDVTPVVVILLILAYFIFRGVSVSKRKNI